MGVKIISKVRLMIVKCPLFGALRFKEGDCPE